MFGFEDDLYTDPEGINGVKCALPGCNEDAAYANEDYHVYKIDHAYFCSGSHALLYNNMVRIGGSVGHYSYYNLKPFNGKVGYSTVPPKFKLRALSEEFEDICLSQKLALGDDCTYYLQYARVNEHDFLSKLTSSRWHLAPNLLTKEMLDEIMHFQINKSVFDRSKNLDAVIQPLDFAQILTNNLVKLFSSPVYRPLPKNTETEVLLSYRDRYRGSFKTHIVEMGKGYLRHWRRTRKETVTYDEPLMTWLPKEGVTERGLYYGKVFGEGRVVYEFLVYAGVSVTYRMDKETGMTLEPTYDLFIQPYLNKLGAL